jgi:hypothetical protein
VAFDLVGRASEDDGRVNAHARYKCLANRDVWVDGVPQDRMSVPHAEDQRRTHR